jgi:hypothetical protein
MSSRTPQRTVYLVTAAIVAAMVGGFAIAQMQLGGTNASYQGSQTTTVSDVPGLTWVNTTMTEILGAATVSDPCTVVDVCDATTSGFTVCAGSFPGLACSESDFVENVTIAVNTLTAFPTHTVALTVYVTGTPPGGTEGTYVGPTSYFTETGTTPTAPLAPENIVLFFDIGTTVTGPGAVSSVSVVATT